MADTYTTNLNLTKPEPGAAEDTWGISLNADLDSLDAIFGSGGTAVSMGAVTLDGLTVSDTGIPQILIQDLDGTNQKTFLKQSNGANTIMAQDGTSHGRTLFQSYNGTNIITRQRIDANGDISFYDSTGTTQGFFWDASDEQLGIGTTNPAYTLDVNSGTTNDTVRFKSSDDTVTIVLEDNDTVNEIESSAVGIRFDLSGSEKLRVNSTGIDVTGTITADGLDLGDGSVLNVGTIALDKIKGDADDNTNITFAGNDTTTFNQGGTERLRVNSTGIDVTGTVTSDGLTVDGSATIKRSGTGTAATIGSQGSTNNPVVLVSTNESANSVSLGVSASVSYPTFYLQNSQKNYLSIGTGGDISFYDSAGTTQGLFWDASVETLAIGHTSPSSTYRLDIAGSIRSFGNAPGLTLQESDASYQTWLMASYGGTFAVRDTTVSGTAYPFQIEAATPSNTLYLDSTGKIGIGTSSPSEKLTLRSTQFDTTHISIGDSVERLRIGYLHAGGLASSTSASQIGSDSSSDLSIAAPSNGASEIKFFTNTASGTPSEALRIDSSQRVGIGTSSPNANLHVLSSGNGEIEIERASGALINLQAQSARGVIGTDTNHELQLKTNGSGRMTINTAGNVGIGTTSIGKTLTVGGSGLRVQSTASADFYSTGQDALVVNNGTANLRFWNNGSERMRIDSVGQVGIGNTAPAKNLHITDSSSPTIRFSRDNSFYWDIGHTSSDFQFISESGGTVLHMNYDGNVGIGTDSPGAALEVNSGGGIHLSDNTAGRTLIIKPSLTGSVHEFTSDNTAAGYAFSNSSSELMRVNSTGLGIGTASPAEELHVFNAGNTTVQIQTSGGGTPTLKFTSPVGTEEITTGVGSIRNMVFRIGGSERARFDSSGNLLVGKTSTGVSVVGSKLAHNGEITGTVAGDKVLILNRTTSDGAIQEFRKDNTTVGSINALSGDLAIGTGDTGVRFHDGTNSLFPVNTTTNANVDDSINIGHSTARFKDLHLSGTISSGDITCNAFSTGLTLSGPVDQLLNLNSTDDGAIYMAFKRSNDRHAYLGFGGGGDNFNIMNEESGGIISFGTSSTERMRIDSSGNLLVGATSYAGNSSSVTGSGLSDGYMWSSRSANAAAIFNRLSTDGDIALFRKDGSTVGSVSVTSSATAYNTSSDARLKDVTGEARGLEVITKLNPVAYNWKADGKADEGLIAQEVKELVPNAVTGSEDEHYQMDYSKLVTHLVKAVQELEQQTIELKEEIANLKGE